MIDGQRAEGWDSTWEARDAADRKETAAKARLRPCIMLQQRRALFGLWLQRLC